MSHRSRFGATSAALLLVACASAPVATPDDKLEGLFAAERSFARASTEHGIRASFLEYFAVDGINFQPGPGSMRERLLAHPPPADPLALLLDWSPQAGAVARSDDLGFTTGPYSLRNQRDATAPTQYGYFFSVWKRENGTWRVAVDAGVSTPAAPEPEAQGKLAAEASKPVPSRVSPSNWHGRGKDALLALEREPWSLDPEPADAPSYFELLASSVRILRDGSYAVRGADAARKTLAAPMRRVQWTPTGAAVAASDDLGYTYGGYVRMNGAAQEAVGYYVHLWQRDDAGAWRIAVEVLLPPA
jgi:ketosteroid isomerase-like protein